MHKENDMLGQTAAVYLRKSRMEEGLETEEVLRRHRQGLDACARRHGLDVVDYYPEVVSGESLYGRPEMLRLLGAWRRAGMTPYSAWIWTVYPVAG